VSEFPRFLLAESCRNVVTKWMAEASKNAELCANTKLAFVGLLAFRHQRLKPFVGGALGLQKVLAPNQSSRVSTRAEPFTRYASDKEHEEGTALINACGKHCAADLVCEF
jgi:hypothetical protein